MLPPTYFHRLPIKHLNVRKPEAWSGPDTLALIQLDETDSQMDLGALDLALLLPSCSAAPRKGGQTGGALPPSGEGKEALPKGGRCWEADAAPLGCVSGSETCSWALRHIGKAKMRITPDAAGGFCYKHQ